MFRLRGGFVYCDLARTLISFRDVLTPIESVAHTICIRHVQSPFAPNDVQHGKRTAA
jgi:hypothetical protein